jgi:NAD+ synthase (glutamine-hydrolysing)
MKYRIVLAQLNFLVGDITGNLDKMMNAAKSARDLHHANMIVFPELCLTGYPPEDLLFRKAFLDETQNALYEFKNQVHDIHCLIGYPATVNHQLTNACSLIYNNHILTTYAKQCLPNYGVFDEHRYFIPGKTASVVEIEHIRFGIVICEDLWTDGPVKDAKNKGAQIILVPNASPFEIDKHEKRLQVLQKTAKENHIPIVYVNCVGGQDELVFDGDSMVINEEGLICQNAGFFTENLLPVDFIFTADKIDIPRVPFSLPSTNEFLYEALVTGVRDYVQKNNFKGALLGLSGGIDSALTLAIAVDALGALNVTAVLMPSEYTADMSNEDAIQLAKNLGVPYEIIPIEAIFRASLQTLHKPQGITKENLQARARGIILMALSNTTGKIVLTSGNRSELAVGYATLYGDMAGGLNVLKDILKTKVYELAHFRNHKKPVIPQRILERAPSAELAPDQKDEDSLPPYSILDQILELYLNEQLSCDDIIAKGFEPSVVKKVIGLIHKNEYKRRQAPVGVRVDHHSFGRDRRYPITSGFDKR